MKMLWCNAIDFGVQDRMFQYLALHASYLIACLFTYTLGSISLGHYNNNKKALSIKILVGGFIAREKFWLLIKYNE